MADVTAQLEALKAKFHDQAIRMEQQEALLEQARLEQRETLALARAVMERVPSEPRGGPTTVYVQRDRKCSDFSGGKEKGEPSVEEWITSMKSHFRVGRVSEEDEVELLKQYLKGEARQTVRLLLSEGSTESAEVFKVLEETYGDKAPVSVRLREFYDRNQAAGETIRQYAYDLQEMLGRLKRRDPTRVPDAATLLQEQFVLSLRDVALRREMRRQLRENPDQKFTQLMQTAIDWSEEEEPPTPANLRNPSRSMVNAASAEDNMPQLTLQTLQESIRQLAARQEHLFQAIVTGEKSQQVHDGAAGGRRAPVAKEECRWEADMLRLSAAWTYQL